MFVSVFVPLVYFYLYFLNSRNFTTESFIYICDKRDETLTHVFKFQIRIFCL